MEWLSNLITYISGCLCTQQEATLLISVNLAGKIWGLRGCGYSLLDWSVRSMLQEKHLNQKTWSLESQQENKNDHYSEIESKSTG